MMMKIINSVNSFIDKVGKVNFILIIFVLFTVIIWGLYGTFSLFTASGGISYSDNTKTYKFIIGNDTANVVTIGANDSKYIDIKIVNNNSSSVLYALYYNASSSSENVIVGYMKESLNPTSGTIETNGELVVSLKIMNNTTSDVDITLGIDSGYESGGELNNSGTRITTEVSNLDGSGANSPNLDNGLIPVYYNSLNDSWYKADDTNTNPEHKWYDYSVDSKMWANAVLVTDDTRNNYLNSSVGTIINSNDILAFYVWIPRYKYHVWNITRQASDQSTYSYSAYTEGIGIEFENGTSSTGNVTCIYNSSFNEDNNNLSDTCKYSGSSISGDNSNYTDAWYTHPAFTYGNRELTGFWVGKFETTGTSTAPSILPDIVSLRLQSVASQFTISKVFRNYGLSKNIDVHMMKNIEWGAVSYLTHSVYGLCTGILCRDVYINDSTNGYTGRSYGDIASDSSTSVYGTYSYDGYLLSGGAETETRDMSKVASTTGNITGIYDLSGGASEYVMGNMVSNSNSFNVGSAGNSWNGTSTLGSKYYDAYSYGNNNSSQFAFNRSRLGDGTAEVTAISDSEVSAWKSGVYISGVGVSFVNSDKPWFVRGGAVSATSGLFSYGSTNGDKGTGYSFRSVLS